MRFGPPASKTSLSLRVNSIDVFWAVVSPFAALALRDPQLLDLCDFPPRLPETYQYALVAVVCGIASLLFFRLSNGISRFFSAHDALNLCGAVACAVVSSSIIVFTFTHLEGVPRSTPLIYGFVFGVCLLVERAALRMCFKGGWLTRESSRAHATLPSLRRVILVGVDAFAAAAIKLTDCQRPRTTQVVAVVAGGSSVVGRKLIGVEIVGLAQDLEAIIDEYAVHGVDIDEVWLSDDAFLPAEVVERIRERCRARTLPCMLLSEAFKLSPPPASIPAATRLTPSGSLELKKRYFRLKRGVDIFAAAILLLILSPAAVCVACLVLFDVGTPVLFWQQRLGRNGRKFLLYKFRTYSAPFDREGGRIPEDERLSRIGRSLRAARLDEIPQLYNVLVGDMSLIGPRPLLPRDQPGDPRLRLLVRPGVTGWAQINGGTIVTAEEKDALDVWYIRHASLALDLKIMLGTALFVLVGEKMNQAAVSKAIRLRRTLLVLGDVSLNGEASFERADY